MLRLVDFVPPMEYVRHSGSVTVGDSKTEALRSEHGRHWWIIKAEKGEVKENEGGECV